MPDPLDADAPPDVVAAVDLGSNSFHLIVAQADGARLQVLDKIKEMVRLAAGLDARNRLRPEAAERALATLERFGQRLREVPPAHVRAVGTNTLRKARDTRAFLEQAEAALGHEIEILSGREEARLIYLGVAHALEDNTERRLVVDIGGGSTELILGRHFEPEMIDSLYMGCVGMTERFFAQGKITKEAMRAARLAAHQELEPIEAGYRRRGWDAAVGSSGTILAVQAVVEAQGWSEEAITADSVARLERELVRAGEVEALRLPGLPTRRAEVLPGGIAILAAVFEALRIERMEASTGALREGLLWDLLGRRHRADIREQTVADLGHRYHVDAEHAARVQATALELLAAVADAWAIRATQHEQLLRWAAWLHEVGMDIAHAQFHKHGAYLLEHMEMPGFSRTEQHKLALLVRAHRRKFPLGAFASLAPEAADALRRLALLLRCSVTLHRSRTPGQAPVIAAIEADRRGLHLVFADRWLSNHPLTRLDLAEEAQAWEVSGLRLSFSEVGRVGEVGEVGEVDESGKSGERGSERGAIGAARFSSRPGR